MNLTFFAPGNPGYILLLIIFVGCIATLLYLNHKRRPKALSHADQLQATYAVMTRQLLDETPGEQVVTAVIANLLGKLKNRNPDPLITMPQLSHGRSAVYFVWLLCKEAEKNGVAALQKKPTVRFLKIGAESLAAVGAEHSANAVRALVTPPEDIDADSPEPLETLEAALAAEQPLLLCRDYIRTQPEDFLDTEY